MSDKYQNPTVITDPDTGNDGVERPKTNPKHGSGTPATAEELAKAVSALQAENERLRAAQNQNSGDDAILKLATLLESAISKPTTTAVPEADPVSRVSDFKNQRFNVDHQTTLEAQQALAEFRNEEKELITVPKSMSNTVGPYLAITVNGVRVSIPCDGKAHYINKTHAVHARERLAKLDKLAADNEPHVVEMN